MKLPPFDINLLALPDYELGLQCWAWWVVAQTESLGFSQQELTPEIVENIRVKTLEIDSDNPTVSALEKTLRLAASGQIERAGKMFRDLMKMEQMQKAAIDEAVTGRRRQTKNAKKLRNRRNDDCPIHQLIADCLDNNQKASAQEVIDYLKEACGPGPEFSIEYDGLYFASCDRQGKAHQRIAETSIPTIISKIRKKALNG